MCRLGRVIRVGEAVSMIALASGGVTTGSGFATSETRLLMIDVVDGALKTSLGVMPSLFVDDLSAEAVGPKKVAVHVQQLSRGSSPGPSVSKTQSVCIASTLSVVSEIRRSLKNSGGVNSRGIRNP